MQKLKGKMAVSMPDQLYENIWLLNHCAQLIPAFFTKDCQLFHFLDSVWPFPGLLCEPGCEQRCIQHGAAAAGNSGTELSGSSLPGLAVLTRDLA